MSYGYGLGVYESDYMDYEEQDPICEDCKLEIYDCDCRDYKNGCLFCGEKTEELDVDGRCDTCAIITKNEDGTSNYPTDNE